MFFYVSPAYHLWNWLNRRCNYKFHILTLSLAARLAMALFGHRGENMRVNWSGCPKVTYKGLGGNRALPVRIWSH